MEHPVFLLSECIPKVTKRAAVASCTLHPANRDRSHCPFFRRSADVCAMCDVCTTELDAEETERPLSQGFCIPLLNDMHRPAESPAFYQDLWTPQANQISRVYLLGMKWKDRRKESLAFRTRIG
jgi:hypothetical protein